MSRRIRNTRPELIELTAFASLTDAAARLMHALPTLCDDAGRAPASPAFIAGAVFFARPKQHHVIGQLISELRAANLIQTYDAPDGSFLEVVGWDDKTHPNYQFIKRRQPPRYPAPALNPGPRVVHTKSQIGTTDRDRDRDRDPERDRRTNPPVLEADFEALQKASTVSQTARDALRDRKWRELEDMRREVAGILGRPYRQLAAFDPGRIELAARILENNEAAEELIDHALAIARAEALQKGTMQFLTGAMFGAKSWRRATSMESGEVGTERFGPKSAELAFAPVREDAPPDFTYGYIGDKA